GPISSAGGGGWNDRAVPRGGSRQGAQQPGLVAGISATEATGEGSARGSLRNHFATDGGRPAAGTGSGLPVRDRGPLGFLQGRPGSRAAPARPDVLRRDCQ